MRSLLPDLVPLTNRRTAVRAYSRWSLLFLWFQAKNDDMWITHDMYAVIASLCDVLPYVVGRCGTFFDFSAEMN